MVPGVAAAVGSFFDFLLAGRARHYCRGALDVTGGPLFHLVAACYYDNDDKNVDEEKVVVVVFCGALLPPPPPPRRLSILLQEPGPNFSYACHGVAAAQLKSPGTTLSISISPCWRTPGSIPLLLLPGRVFWEMNTAEACECPDIPPPPLGASIAFPSLLIRRWLITKNNNLVRERRRSISTPTSALLRILTMPTSSHLAAAAAPPSAQNDQPRQGNQPRRPSFVIRERDAIMKESGAEAQS